MRCALQSLEKFTQEHSNILTQFSFDREIINTIVNVNDLHGILKNILTTHMRCRKMMTPEQFKLHQPDIEMKTAQLNDLFAKYTTPFLGVLDERDNYPNAGIGFPTLRLSVIYNMTDNIVICSGENDIEDITIRDFLQKIERIYYIPQ